jgi:RNA polymerase sigma factor (sigma-70 family)
LISPGEKERLLEETLAQHRQCLGVIARNNAPGDSWQDLEQEIRIAFWKSLDRYDGSSSSLGTWFYSVAMNTAREFRRKNRNGKKNEERVDPNSAFAEQDRDELKVVEDFIGSLGGLDREIFTMYLDDYSYAEMSSAIGMDEANLRKRMSRIKGQFKARYNGG